MKQMVSVLICFVLLNCQVGCWDAKDIQAINYVTAIGVDYMEDKYIVYIQILDFTHVANAEGSKTAQDAPVWVGKGTGVTVNEAINNIYKSSQQRIFWGHVTTLVFSENILKKGIQEVIDLTNRYREIRYTKWMYGTSLPLEQVFSVTPFFKLSPLSSILHEPVELYRQASNIKPIQFNTFSSTFHEPAAAVLLPSLSIDNKTWVETEKPSEMLYSNGAYLLQREKYLGWLSANSLHGKRWFTPAAARIPLVIYDDKPIVTLIASNPMHSIDYELMPIKPKFHISIQVKLTINELISVISESEIKKKASESIEREIRKTYQEGLELKVDVLELGDAIFKKNPSYWHKYWDNGQFPLDSDSIETIQVSINLLNSGKYKLTE